MSAFLDNIAGAILGTIIANIAFDFPALGLWSGTFVVYNSYFKFPLGNQAITDAFRHSSGIR